MSKKQRNRGGVAEATASTSVDNQSAEVKGDNAAGVEQSEAPQSNDAPDEEQSTEANADNAASVEQSEAIQSNDAPNDDQSSEEEEPEAKEQQKASSEEIDKNRAIAERYAKLYPNEKAFVITSDGQVFLSKNMNLAVTHQRTLKSGELETVNID